MNFLWNGSVSKGSWTSIMKPKMYGGWGLKDLVSFGRALLMKSLWRGIMTKGIWSEILRYKYLKEKGMEDLLKVGWNNTKGASTIWNGFKQIWPNFTCFLKWKFGDGGKILIGSRTCGVDRDFLPAIVS